MLKLICKLSAWEEQKTQTKISFTFKNLNEEIKMDLTQYEGDDGYLLFHVDRHKSEVVKLLKTKDNFIDDLGNSPSKKMMIALKNRWLKKKEELNMSWEEYYPYAINKIIEDFINSKK